MDQFLNFIALEDDMFILREYQSALISYQGNNTSTYTLQRGLYIVINHLCSSKQI